MPTPASTASVRALTNQEENLSQKVPVVRRVCWGCNRTIALQERMDYLSAVPVHKEYHSCRVALLRGLEMNRPYYARVALEAVVDQWPEFAGQCAELIQRAGHSIEALRPIADRIATFLAEQSVKTVGTAFARLDLWYNVFAGTQVPISQTMERLRRPAVVHAQA